MDTLEKINRVRVLKAMDLLVRFMNDETGLELWLMEGVEDTEGLTEIQALENYIYAAEDEDYDSFKQCCDVFTEIISNYGKHGWYCKR